jgi:hypothetical protein
MAIRLGCFADKNHPFWKLLSEEMAKQKAKRKAKGSK